MITFKIGSVTGNGYKEVNLGKVSLWSEGNKEVTKDYKMVTLGHERVTKATKGYKRIEKMNKILTKKFQLGKKKVTKNH